MLVIVMDKIILSNMPSFIKGGKFMDEVVAVNDVIDLA